MSVTKNNKVLSEQLVAHFDLNSDPFEEVTGVFFEGAQRQHNLETLRHMSTFGDMVLLLTGERGAGKTTLISRFLEVCSDDLHIYVSDIREMEAKEKAQSVIQQLASSIGLSIVQGETTRQAFSRLLQSLEERFQSDGKRNVLVFDNADALPKKELQFYFSYFSQLPKESGVVAVFTGSPSLLQVARLSNIDGSEEWLHQLQLKPFGASDMLEYLQQRLELVGYKGLLELSESQVQHLIDIGKGLPGRVNRLFSSVVLEPGSLKLPSKRSPKIPKFLIPGVLSLLVFSFMVVAYQYGLFGGDVGGELDGVDEGTSSKLVLEDSGVEGLRPIIPDDNKQEELNRLEKQRAERIKMLDKALSESLITDNKKTESKLGENKPEESKIENNLTSPPSGEVSNDTVEVQEKVIETSVLAKNMEKGSVEKDSPKIDVKKTEPARVTSVVSPQSGVKDKKESHPLFKTRSWLESQNQFAYSAQILGSYKEQTAIQFAQKVSRESSSIFYLKTLHRGKPWYVVFYGVFPDKAAAKEAINKAPTVISSQQPWLRRIDGILNSYPK